MEQMENSEKNLLVDRWMNDRQEKDTRDNSSSAKSRMEFCIWNAGMQTQTSKALEAASQSLVACQLNAVDDGCIAQATNLLIVSTNLEAYHASPLHCAEYMLMHTKLEETTS